MRTRTVLLSRTGLLTALACAALAPAGAFAQEESGEFSWKFFVGGAYVVPLNDSEISGSVLEAKSEFGLELGIEWKPLDRFGFELAYLDATNDVEYGGTKAGEIDFKPWNFTFNIHLIDRNGFNWYIGPTLTYVDWGDIEGPAGVEPIDSEIGYGVSTGLAIGIGQTFAIQLGLRYLDSSADSATGSDSLDVDPLLASVGFAFRF